MFPHICQVKIGFAGKDGSDICNYTFGQVILFELCHALDKSSEVFGFKLTLSKVPVSLGVMFKLISEVAVGYLVQHTKINLHP